MKLTYDNPQLICTTCGKPFTPFETEGEKICGTCRGARVNRRKVRICLECDFPDCEHLRASRSIPPRVAQCLECLSRGLTDKEIATELGLSVGTVKVYHSHLYELISVKTRTQAALWALAHPAVLDQVRGVTTAST